MVFLVVFVSFVNFVAAAVGRPSVLRDEPPGDRNILRRDGRRRHRRDRRSGEALGAQVQHRRVAGRDPPRVGRSRARTGLAPAPPRHLRRRRSRARDRRGLVRGSGRRSGDAGTWPRRFAAGRRVVCEVAGVVVRDSARAGASSGRAHRVAGAAARGIAAAGRGARRLRRPYEPLPGSRAGPIRADWTNERRRGGGGLRQGGEAARIGPARG